MTSVMPAWKQQLIEKKRQKERELQAKEKESHQKIASVPEWKRHILEKKKKEAHQSDDIVPSNNSNHGHGVFGTKFAARKSPQTIQQGLGNDSGQVQGLNSAFESYRGAVNDRGSVQNDIRVRHSGVATGELSRASEQQQQILNKHETPKSFTAAEVNHSSARDQTQKSSDSDIKVAYEHVRPPSELRKLFDGARVSNKTSRPVVSSANVNSLVVSNSGNIQTSTQGAEYDLSSTDATSAKEETEQKTHSQAIAGSNLAPKVSGGFPSDQIRSETELVSRNNENILERANNIELNDEFSVDSNRFKTQHQNSDHNNTGLPADEKLESLHNDHAPSPIPHVNELRSKFGSVGKFHRKCSSVENLLTTSPEGSDSSVVMRTGFKKRPVLTKRWTADLSTLMSPTRSVDYEDEEDFIHGLDAAQERRQRSISMHDLSKQDGFPQVHFRHRASISHGIESRVHELLRHASHSESQTEADDEEFMDIRSTEDDFLSSPGGTMPGVFTPPVFEEEPTTLRTASWMEQETVAIADQENQRHSERTRETDLSSRTKEIIIIEKDKGTRIADHDLEVTSFKEPPPQFRSEIEKTVPHVIAEPQYTAYNGDVTSLESGSKDYPGEEIVDVKPSRGSVHKLSAMFGSSILKGSSKDKNKEKKSENKKKIADEKQNAKLKKAEENKANEKNKSNGSSKRFPWSKSNTKNKSEDKKVVNFNDADTEPPFKGMKHLRHVETKPIERQITGQMTLVIDSDADSYRPKPKRTQNMDNAVINRNQNSVLQNGQTDFTAKSVHTAPKQEALGQKIKPVPVTSIDVPPPPIVEKSKEKELITRIDVSEPSDVEVSAIDVPESPKSQTPVSVIDMPTPDDVSVSVIDVPDQFRDDGDDDEVDSDDSDADIHSGSYDVTIGTHPLILSFGQRNGNESSDFNSIQEEEEEEEEEDIDDVPVSYVGDSTYMKVPVVVFNKPPERVKPCINSPMIRRKKEKVKVKFPAGNLHKVHDYPSEDCLASHYDQYTRENNGKSLSNYKPSTIESYEETLKLLQQKRASEVNKSKNMVVDSDVGKSGVEVTSITYADEGDGFSSSSSSGALLF